MKGDSPQQKLLGCVTDTLGVVMLSISIIGFEIDCFELLPNAIGDVQMVYGACKL